MGVRAYIEGQLHPERIDDRAMTGRLAGFTTLTKSTRDLAEDYFLPAMMERREQQRRAARNGGPSTDAGTSGAQTRTPEQMQLARMQRTVIGELSQQRILRAVYSERQLEEVLVDFWFNHFNVFAGKGPVRYLLTEYERDAIRPHVLGKLPRSARRDGEEPGDALLSRQLAERRSERARRRATRRRRAAARRGTPRRRPPTRWTGGAQVERRRRPQRELRARAAGAAHARRRRRLHAAGRHRGRARVHRLDDRDPRRGGGGSGSSRGCTTPARRSCSASDSRPAAASKDGEQVLDILARHPSTARFIATKLARRFVADEPPPALVDRGGAVFGDRRRHPRGGARRSSPRRSSSRAEPPRQGEDAVRVRGQRAARHRRRRRDERAAARAALRDSACRSTVPAADRLSDTAEAWVNTGALLNRMNFAVALSDGGQMRARRRRRHVPAADPPMTCARAVDEARSATTSARRRRRRSRRRPPAQAVAALCLARRSSSGQEHGEMTHDASS